VGDGTGRPKARGEKTKLLTNLELQEFCYCTVNFRKPLELLSKYKNVAKRTLDFFLIIKKCTEIKI
jgi:hypothetical protein